MFDPMWDRGTYKVGSFNGDALGNSCFRINRPKAQFHKNLGANDRRRRSLDHSHVSTMLPQSGAGIMRGIVRANDRAFLAFVTASAGEIAIVILLAGEMRVGNTRRNFHVFNDAQFTTASAMDLRHSAVMMRASASRLSSSTPLKRNRN